MSGIYDYTGRPVAILGQNALEPASNDIPVVTITGELYSTKEAGKSNVVIAYKSATESFTDYGTAKVQGDSSVIYPKKNYTITLFTDSARKSKSKRQFRDWDKPRNKFVLKANWIDHSHARNIVNARLWAQIMRSRSDYNGLPAQLRNGNLAVDGFPVKVYNNGVYLGLYTWNLPKDAMYGLDSDLDENAIVQSDGSNQDGLSMYFKDDTIGGKWSDEFHDEMPTAIETGWTAALAFVCNSTDAEFKQNVGMYFDLQSLIDVHIFLQACYLRDCIAKNQTFYTYNGSYYYAGMYDMDGAWGLRAISLDKGFLPDDAVFQNDYAGYEYCNGNRLHDKLTANFATEIAARYAELRTSVLSEDNICSEYDKFMSAIPPYLYAEDYAETTGGGAFTGIPLVETNNILQIRDYVGKRLAYVDAHLV